jgi:hypothetical protein
MTLSRATEYASDRYEIKCAAAFGSRHDNPSKRNFINVLIAARNDYYCGRLGFVHVAKLICGKVFASDAVARISVNSFAKRLRERISQVAHIFFMI